MFMNIASLSTAVESDPDLEQKMKDDPKATLKTIAALPLQSDVWIYRGVILALGFAICSTIAASAVLAFYGNTLPEGMASLAATAVGAMAGLLAPSPNRS